MRGFLYTITNNHTGKSFSMNLNTDGTDPCNTLNGFILQENPSFNLAIRNEDKSKSGQHGGLEFFSFYGNRAITFQGILLASSYSNLIQQQSLVREVLSLPAQPIQNTNDGYVTVSWTDESSNTWEIQAKMTQDMTFSRSSGNRLNSTFFLALKATSPWILSSTTFTESQLHGWRQGRMILPVFLPNTINIDWNRLVNIYQAGTADSPGTYRMTGPLVNPKITKLIESFSNSTTISDFSSGWTGGTADTTNFQTAGQGLKLTSTGSQDTATLTSALDLTGGEFITFYLHVDDVDNIAFGDYTVGLNYIKFIENAGVDEFVLEFEEGSPTMKDLWNYFQALRDEFKTIGSPSWDSITSVELSIKAKTGTTLNITFDDLRNRDITHSEQKLELALTLTTNELIDFNVETGTIEKGDGTDVSGSLTTDSEWFYISPRQNLILLESDNNPLATFELPFTINDPVIEDDLVAYWPMEASSGTTVTDYVGSNDGIADAAVAVNIGAGWGGSNAREFDGASGAITIPDSLDYRNLFDGGGSVVVVVNPTSDGENNAGRILQKTGGWKIYVSAESAGFVKVTFEQEFSGTNGTWITTSADLELSELSTIVIRYDSDAVGNNPTLEINGVTSAITESSTPVGTRSSDVGGALLIGNRAADDRTFDGLIDEPRLYDASISDARALELGFNPDLNKYKEQLTVSWQSALL